jgi:C-terminal processing protease CtpA/Prc
MEVQVSNLQRFAMVWGFAKYTHPSFLSGQLCWDEELLSLIPVVRFAEEGQVNNILYEWFVGLGDDGFDNNRSVFLLAPFSDDQEEEFIMNFIEMVDTTDWLSFVGVRFGPDYLTMGLRVDKNQLDVLPYNDEHFGWLHSLEPMNASYMKPLINMDWLTDESFLGNSLASVFSRFTETPMIDRTNAPVFFNSIGLSDFSNQSLHTNMDFEDAGYRLLGLFRLWNAMKYFFPYIDIIDECWNGLLLTHIPLMLEGTSQISYELALKSLASSLHDAHIHFSVTSNAFDFVFGQFVIPARLTEAEGHIVVIEPSHRVEGVLMLGDAILSINGIDINEIATNMLQYVSYPNEEKALFYLTRYHVILRQHHDVPMNLVILRNGIEKTIEVEVVHSSQVAWQYQFPPQPEVAYMRLENNIGIINPSMVQEGDISHIMRYFSDTNGLIIDLRQYPNARMSDLIGYIVEDNRHLVTFTLPSQSVPGMFTSLVRYYSVAFRYGDDETPYLYANAVVVLMYEGTVSAAETAIMYLRQGRNVTVIGSNSIGANGNIFRFPLPGGVFMTFSSLGVFTPEGGQTQRIGLSPDIHVERTIAGIREGRDELLEAAINYLMSMRNP